MVANLIIFPDICHMKKSFLYTRTGDEGMTSLVGGSRVPKHSMRVCAYGEVDELNANVGLVQALCAAIDGADDDAALLHQASARLFDIGAHLATPAAKGADGPDVPAVVTASDIEALEQRIDALDSTVAPQRSFILPGGTVEASHTHVARAVCRRAERAILAFTETTGERVDPSVLRYINRLSDYLFILARYLNHLAGVADIPWSK